MLRFLGLLMLLAIVFSLGYYTGQHPVGELNKTLRGIMKPLQDQTRKILDSTLGMERDLRVRHRLVEAKARLIQAKAELLDRNYGNAARELDEAAKQLEHTRLAQQGDESTMKVRELITQVREARVELRMGKMVSRTRLDGIQKDLDALLASQGEG